MKNAYSAYLLRLYRVSPSDASPWRTSLEDVHTHQVRVFADLLELHHYLVMLTGGTECQGETSDKDEFKNKDEH